ncbi:hydrolase [Streptomyces longispororuber]|uniref:hydrolase n=1 Tax=Streptomyces longispororuber TaxID=68230 RepID=UPI00210B2CFF|nr:hydrolase [Streptomyces longispororuber]MCQ4209690.1 hydrolase [Streptomyces longispororuber]
MEPILSRLPAALRDVRYDGARFPGAAVVAGLPGVAAGANCQLYAYEVLRHFGRRPADLRSSELWEDAEHSVRVPSPEPLDLLLFSADGDAYGAHVGLWAGEDAVLHLCAEVGRPAVWGLAEFAARRRYRVLVGIKRVTGRPAPG